MAVVLSAFSFSLCRADDDKKDAKKDADKPAVEEEEKDPYAVPDGDAKELTEYIQGLLKTPPRSKEQFDKTVAALVEAADKLLKADPDDQQEQLAVGLKARFLPTIEEKEAFADELEKADKKKLARMVRGSVLTMQLSELLRGPQKDAQEKLKALIEKVKDFVNSGDIGRGEVALLMRVAQITEMVGDDKLTLETYKSFGEILAKNENKQIAAMAKMMDGVVKRLSLPGNEMKVEGTILGGKALDWAKYRGKVVLVDFWATWCGPCVAEIPNMKKAYEAYHDRGFEILGLSVDDDKEAVEKFVEKREIPWPIVYGEDGPSPTVEYYGVMSVPTMILVDKDGKVISLRARGPALEKKLAELLGPVEEPKDDEGSAADDEDKDNATGDDKKE